MAKVTYVTDLSGVRGELLSSPSPGATGGTACVVLDNDRRLYLPAELLEPQPEGDYRVRFNFSEAEAAAEGDAALVIPVIEEQVRVGKRVVETGRVRLHKSVHTQKGIADLPLLREDVEIVRVPIGRRVEEAPEARLEGETLVIPLVEEVLVVTKQLVLREELHVTRWQSTYHDPQEVLLRREEVDVERVEEDI